MNFCKPANRLKGDINENLKATMLLKEIKADTISTENWYKNYSSSSS
jgi:hypothetical protein